MTKPVYNLTLTPLPGRCRAADLRGLRAILKRLLRDHGYRALTCEPSGTITTKQTNSLPDDRDEPPAGYERSSDKDPEYPRAAPDDAT